MAVTSVSPSFSQLVHVANRTGRLDTHEEQKKLPSIVLGTQRTESTKLTNKKINKVEEEVIQKTTTETVPSTYTDPSIKLPEAIQRRTIQKVSMEQQIRELEKDILKEPKNLEKKALLAKTKINLAHNVLFLNDKSYALQLIKEVEKMDISHHLIYFSNYSIKFYEGIPIEAKSIKEVILLLRKSLAVDPTFASASKALNYIVETASPKLGKQIVEEFFKEDPFKGVKIEDNKVSAEYTRQYPAHTSPFLLKRENYFMNEGKTFTGTPEMLRQLISEEFKGKRNEIFLDKMTPEAAKVITEIMLDFDHPHDLIVGVFTKEDCDVFFKVFENAKCDGIVMEQKLLTPNKHFPVVYRLFSDNGNPLRPVGASIATKSPRITKPEESQALSTDSREYKLLNRIIWSGNNPLISETYYKKQKNDTLAYFDISSGKTIETKNFEVVADHIFKTLI